MGLPEKEALGSLLLKQLVKGLLRTGKNVRWQRGTRLPSAAQVKLGHLEQCSTKTNISIKRLQDILLHDSADLFPKHKSEFILNFEPHLLVCNYKTFVKLCSSQHILSNHNDKMEAYI